MKKLSLLVLFLMGGTTFLFAQNKPDMGAYFVVGLQGGLNSLNFSQGDSAANVGGMVGFRYKMSNGITGRLGLNLSMRNQEYGSTFNGVENLTTMKGTNFGIMLGAHKSFEGTDNLETYIGADLSVATVGGGETIVRSEVVDTTDTGGEIGDFTETTTTHAKGIEFGLTPFVGFQYFFVPKLAIGGEFGYGVFISGIKDGETVREDSFGGTTTTTTLESGVNNKSTGLAGRGTGRVILTVYF